MLRGIVKSMAKAGMLVLAMATIFLAVGGYVAWQWLNTPLNQHFETKAVADFVSPALVTTEYPVGFKVRRGDNLRVIAKSLQTDGLIQLPRVWVLYARYLKISNAVKAGDYTIEGAETPIDLLHRLVAGDVQYEKLTIVEGIRFNDMLTLMRDSDDITIKMADKPLADIAVSLGFSSAAELEGWFYPDTLSFAQGTDDLTLLLQGKAKMEAVLADEWANKAEGLPLETPLEALTLASIIEKETGRGEEREQIAGVFIRRLQKNMRLQTDPTVIYGMGDSYAGNIRSKDLRTDTPYNTYTRSGLPPGPIALPGRAAIHAALHPANGDALFFVAKGDGGHYFSATLAEHEKAVRKYQLRKRRKDYRSSP